MRKPIIAGNWKMNTTVQDGIELALSIVDFCKNTADVDIVICPPFTHLASIFEIINNTNINLGAQNMYWEDNGAYTGEISSEMLKSVGCSHVIIGHSERREMFRESNENVNKKVLAALDEGLIPILAVGETLAERESNKTEEKIKNQIETALVNVDSLENIIVAYEPIWAIGTGRTASPEQANEVIGFIRSTLGSLFSDEQAKKTRIIYGGSANSKNIDSLMAESDIDGALVGGASLEAESFSRMINFRA